MLNNKTFKITNSQEYQDIFKRENIFMKNYLIFYIRKSILLMNYLLKLV